MQLNDTPGTLIIALGNPLRADDGVAWHVADALLSESLPDDWTVLTAHQLLPEMAQAASAAGQVIFVDASMDHLPGEVAALSLPDTPLDLSRGTHELDVPGLLALAGRLFGRRPPAVLVVIGGESFGMSESLTPAVAVAVEPAVALVRLVAASPVAAP